VDQPYPEATNRGNLGRIIEVDCSGCTRAARIALGTRWPQLAWRPPRGGPSSSPGDVAHRARRSRFTPHGPGLPPWRATHLRRTEYTGEVCLDGYGSGNVPEARSGRMVQSSPRTHRSRRPIQNGRHGVLARGEPKPRSLGPILPRAVREGRSAPHLARHREPPTSNPIRRSNTHQEHRP
jgi:hypothetical protein